MNKCEQFQACVSGRKLGLTVSAPSHSLTVLILLTLSTFASAQSARDEAIVQTLLRLPSVDVNSKPKYKEAVLRYLKTKEGTARYVELVDRLGLRGVEDRLLQMAIADPDGNVGVKAASLLVQRGQTETLAGVLDGHDPVAATSIATVLGLVGGPTVGDLLRPIVTDSTKSRAVRAVAARGLGRSRDGQHFLLELAREGELAKDLQFAAANALLGSADPRIRDQAGMYLRLPAAADSKPLPPISELLKMTGDAGRGAELYRTTGTCIKCHVVNGAGKQVGPDLSEIGSKLSPEAMFVSILDPSAGISHNYESYTAILDSGMIVSGVIVNRTESSITIRTAEAIDKTFSTAKIEELIKSEVSLMPADLQKALSAQDLVDIVEYLIKRVGSGKVGK